MKRLWKSIPPYMSDVVGFEAVVNETDGAGIIDDSAHYKPVRPIREPRAGDVAHGAGRGGRDDKKDEKRHGKDGRAGKGGGRSLAEMGMRVIHTGIRNEDVIYGTDQIVQTAAERVARELHPAYVLFAHAPSAATIGSDLSFAADRLGEETGISTASVPVDGERDYLYGVSETLATLGRLLAEPGETVPHTLNVLGCNPIDWTADQYDAFVALLGDAGWTVTSCWGMREQAERLRAAATAQVNVVVGAAGVRLAEYLATVYGTPAIYGAPFGEKNVARLLGALEQVADGGNAAQAAAAASPSSGDDSSRSASAAGQPILVLAEQFTANAIRAMLEDRGYGAVRVASFLEMPKARRRPGDVKLASEDDLVREVAAASCVIGSPDCRPLAPVGTPWIDVPDPGRFSSTHAVGDFNKIGGAFDTWLDTALEQTHLNG